MSKKNNSRKKIQGDVDVISVEGMGIENLDLLNPNELKRLNLVVEEWRDNVNEWPNKIVIVEDESKIGEGYSAGWSKRFDVIYLARKNRNNFPVDSSLYKELMTMLFEKFREQGVDLVAKLCEQSRLFKKTFKRNKYQAVFDNHPDKLAESNPEFVPADNFGHFMVKLFWKEEDRICIMKVIKQLFVW